MRTLIERRFEMKPGRKDDLLSLLEKNKENLKNDEHIRACSILTPRDEDDVVLVRYLLHDDADWNKRMAQAYVNEMLEEIKDMTKDIKSSHCDVHHFHGS